MSVGASRTVIIVCLITTLLYSCMPTPITLKLYKNEDFNFLGYYSIAVLPTTNQFLTEDEIENINDHIYDRIYNGLYWRSLLEPEQSLNLFRESNLLEEWDSFWENYTTTGAYAKKTLLDIYQHLKLDLIIQAKVIRVDKKLAKYREYPGETSAAVKISMFSTKTAELVWEGNCRGTIINAFSTQRHPLPIEAIDLAFDELYDKIPFPDYGPYGM